VKLALSSDGLRAALRGWATSWLAKVRPNCDWCGHKLYEVDEFVEWCLTLREAWPSHLKRLPSPRVFCGQCAVGAITELHGGPRFVPDWQESIPF